ncbi:MAG: MFS transporter [Erysipelotrichia bacterium]|nr:MFS transporter [Erysipelotrichia bacterium]
MAAFLICTGFTSAYALTALGLAVTGFFFVSFSATANSTVQFNTEDEYRGRVMSVYTWVFSGFTPAGNFYVGMISEHLGPSVGFIASGLIILVLVFLINLLFGKREKKHKKCED